MNILNVMIWNDATVKGNDVECIVSIDIHDVGMLVCAELQRRTGKKFQHCEVRGVTSDPLEVEGVKSLTIDEVEI